MKRYDEVLRRLDLSQPVIGAEIGVYKGAMSRQLLQAPKLTLYMVDSWKGNVGLTVTARKCVAFAGDRAKVIMGRSLEASDRFGDKFFDFVFIDADHSLGAVEADIRAWRPKIKDGGWLCGHDYGKGQSPGDGTCWGVDVAVNRFVKLTGLKLETGDDYTWFIRLP